MDNDLPEKCRGLYKHLRIAYIILTVLSIFFYFFNEFFKINVDFLDNAQLSLFGAGGFAGLAEHALKDPGRPGPHQKRLKSDSYKLAMGRNPAGPDTGGWSKGVSGIACAFSFGSVLGWIDLLGI